MLELSRLQSGTASLSRSVFAPLPLLDLIHETYSAYAEDYQQTFVYDVPKDLPNVVGNPDRTQQVLIALLDNAFKYTPEGGKISVSVKEEPFEKENYIAYRIIVEDNGIGMSKEYLPHIFEEFSREHTSTESKVTGTGLGLPIVKSLIDMMGGTIEVESQLGCGTKMTVVLPFELASE